MPTVTVTVTDADGNKATKSIDIAVVTAPTPGTPPVLSIANMPHVVGSSLVYYGATGVEKAQALTTLSNPSTNANGQIIDGRDINGTLTVNHANCIIRRCRLRGGYYYGIYNAANSPLIVEDCEIVGPTGPNGAAAIGFTNLTLRRVNIHDCAGDGVKFGSPFVGDTLWLHHFNPTAGAHADCFQTTGSGPNGTFLLKNSHIDPGPLLGGGIFGIQLGDEGAAIGRIEIDTCRFGPNHKPIGGGYPATKGEPNPYILRNIVFHRPWNTGAKPVINYRTTYMQQSNLRDDAGVAIVL